VRGGGDGYAATGHLFDLKSQLIALKSQLIAPTELRPITAALIPFNVELVKVG
jgi:hypothetical protein